MTSICRKRTVGIVFSGFEINPHELALTFNVLSERKAKGEPLYRTNPEIKYSHNKLHFAKEIPRDAHWGDTLEELLYDMGGIDNVMKFIESIAPVDYAIVINVIRPAYHVNGFEPRQLQIIQQLNCELVFNFFDNE